MPDSSHIHPVPPDLPLEKFVGDACPQIRMGRFQLEFRFYNAGRITVEGRWELRDPTGAVVDQSAWDTAEQVLARDVYRIHKIIDVPVSRYSIDTPPSFTLFFENGYALTIYVDPTGSESFDVNGYIV